MKYEMLVDLIEDRMRKDPSLNVSIYITGLRDGYGLALIGTGMSKHTYTLCVDLYQNILQHAAREAERRLGPVAIPTQFNPN